MAAQGQHLAAQGLHMAPQGLHLAAQRRRLVAKGLHMAAQGLHMHHIAVYAVYGGAQGGPGIQESAQVMLSMGSGGPKPLNPISQKPIANSQEANS